MNKKGNSIDRKNVECYYKKRGGVANKIMHIAQTRRKILKKKEKQWLSIALSAAMVVTGIPAAGIGTTVQAASGEAQVSVKNGEVTIGNEYLERKFSTSDNKLATTELDNKRADLTFTPAQGSEEFIIKLRQDGTTKLDGELDRTNWTVTASDQYNNEVGAKDGPGANVIDGDASTICTASIHRISHIHIP